MHQPTTGCLNCGASFVPGARFCHHCGQTAAIHRLNLSHLLHEVVHFFTHADKGIFYLVRKLAVQPGRVARQYVQGKRKQYFSPLNFFLVVAGLFVFVNTTLKPMNTINMEAARVQVMKIPDPETRERRLAKLERAEKATNFMARNSNYVNMAVTPMVAFIFFLFFLRAGDNYTEHLVANLYLAGFIILLYIFFISPLLLLVRGTPYYLWVIYLYLAIELVYRTLGYYQFVPRKGSRHLLHCFLAALVTVVSWSALSRGLIGWYIENGFR